MGKYNISFYARLPLLFWVIMVLIYVFLVVISWLLSHLGESARIFLLPMIVTNFFLFYLPVLLGDFIYTTGDDLTAIGHIKYILNNGSIFEKNIYPIFHLLLAELGIVTEMKITVLIGLFLGLIAGCLPLLTYFPAKKITGDVPDAVLLTTLSSIPIFGTAAIHFTPFSTSFLLFLPIIIGVLFAASSGRREWILLALLMGFVVAFSHPLVAITTGALFAPFFLVQSISENPSNISITFYKLGGIIPLATLIMWLESIEVPTSGRPGIFSWSVTRALVVAGTSKADTYSETSNYINIGALEIIQAIIFEFGAIILFFLAAGLAIIYIWSSFLLKQRFDERETILATILTAIGSVTVLVAGIDLTFQFNRVMLFGCLFASLLIGLHVTKRMDSSLGLRYSLIALFILSGTAIVPFTVFDAPEINQRSSSQITHQHYEASHWTLEHTGPEASLGHFRINLDRMHDAIYGPDSSQNARYITENLTSDYYLQSDKDILIYKSRYNQYPNFYPYDFDKFVMLEERKDKIYNNDGGKLLKS